MKQAFLTGLALFLFAVTALAHRGETISNRGTALSATAAPLVVRKDMQAECGVFRSGTKVSAAPASACEDGTEAADFAALYEFCSTTGNECNEACSPWASKCSSQQKTAAGVTLLQCIPTNHIAIYPDASGWSCVGMEGGVSSRMNVLGSYNDRIDCLTMCH